MPFDPENAPHLRPWLVRTLEPICDAEPGALAEYILALLKHNAPEADLRKELTAQLEEFLEKETSSFIDTLFVALRSKSYLPYSAPSPTPASGSQTVDTGIPIPLDALLSPSLETPDRTLKRSIDHDDRDSLPPAKGPRLNNDGNFSRYGRGDNRSSWGNRGDRGGRMGMNGRGDYNSNGGGLDGPLNGGLGGGMNNGLNGRGIQAYHPPERRGICRDYHNNGYCARGAYCKYSHGDDAVIPAPFFPMAGAIPGGSMPFVPVLPNGNPSFGMSGTANVAYDPHERMDMRPPTGPMGMNRPHNPRAPIIHRQQAETNGHVARKPGELPVIQDLTPQVPPDANAMQEPSDEQYPLERGIMDVDINNAYNGMPGMSQDVEMAGPSMHMNGRGGPRGSMRVGPRGSFDGDVHSLRPDRRNDKTLVVEKIPEDKLSLGSINDWFKQFGTVTNVAVDAMNAKALVTFSNNDEARAAWNCKDAVFGNRFVKIFWHHPMGGHGQLGARMLAASAPIVAAVTARVNAPAPAEQVVAPIPASTSTPRKPSAATTALATKQKLLEKQITEQKALMSQLSTASPQEKKDIMVRLRKLGEEMKPTPSTSQHPAPAATAVAAVTPRTPRSHTPRADDHERKERERLDKELELHHAVAAVKEDGEESTAELAVRLAKLQEEAAKLGLPEASEAPYHTGPYRPLRGRGRGRSFFRGAARGGPPRASMKLDNRPKKLLVKGVPTESFQAVRDWYETTGHLESAELDSSGDIIVSFKTRGAAEQGLSKGVNIATVGPVQISWYTGLPSDAATLPPRQSPVQISVAEDKGTFKLEDRQPSPKMDDDMEEEVVAGGWGGDDDGYGML